MRFTIYVVQNGFLLNVHQGDKTTSYVFAPKDRMKMLALIDKRLGLESIVPEERPS